MQLVDANSETHVRAEESAPTTINYFAGTDSAKWLTNIPTSKRVRYSQVYPGIDLVYYGNQRQLEYDLLVAPGADFRQISLAFTGVEKVEIEEASGDLLLHTSLGVLRQHQPSIYQETDGYRKKIAGHYVQRSDSRIGFEVASYDTTKPLVIDPTLVYSTFVGGTNPGQGENIGGDSVGAIAVDDAGNAYITGTTMSTDFPYDHGRLCPALTSAPRTGLLMSLRSIPPEQRSFIPPSSLPPLLPLQLTEAATALPDWFGGSRFPGTAGSVSASSDWHLG